MSFNHVVLFLIGAFAISCSGWNSELDTIDIGNNKIQNKPQCAFKTRDNCFTRSMNLLMSCIGEKGGDEEYLTEDLRLCTSESGKRIIFDTPLDLVGNFSENELSYTIYEGQNKCFRFTGTQDHFKIDQNAFGVIEVTTLSDGSTQVSCFFNESFKISKDAKEKGCSGEKANTSLYIPKAVLQQKKAPQFLEPSDINHFSFAFEGVGYPAQVFDCRL